MEQRERVGHEKILIIDIIIAIDLCFSALNLLAVVWYDIHLFRVLVIREPFGNFL